MNIDELLQLANPDDWLIEEASFYNNRWVFVANKHRVIGLQTSEAIPSSHLQDIPLNKREGFNDTISKCFQRKQIITLDTQKFYSFLYTGSCSDPECILCDCLECNGDGVVDDEYGDRIPCDECCLDCHLYAENSPCWTKGCNCYPVTSVANIHGTILNLKFLRQTNRKFFQTLLLGDYPSDPPMFLGDNLLILVAPRTGNYCPDLVYS